MIQRRAGEKLKSLAGAFKAVAVIGPRQAGKTTLVRTLFADKPYVSLENPDTLRFSMDDPRGFLDTYPQGAILDEAQRAPHLFSYLQERLDDSRAKGQYILTGSNNFLLQQSIAQSLAGRIGYLTLMPFSVPELMSANALPPSLEATIFTGAYPPIYDQEIAPTDWYPAYIRTYVERDVRQIKNITDLLTFSRFLRLCAGRTGQELNYASLAVETGVDVKTAQAWIGVLESSFVVHLLPAFHRNYNKTIVRRPKLYFTDTGLTCSLLGITEAAQLATHPLRGPLFETLVVNELLKARLCRGLPSNLSYWRDKTGREVDVVIEEEAGRLIPVEIKAGKTVQPQAFTTLRYWQGLSGAEEGWLIYAGDEAQIRSDGMRVIPWKALPAQA